MKRILIVEDKPNNMRLMEQIVEDIEKTKVVKATNGKDALDAVDNEKVDLILMDVSLPDMNGMELSGMIHNQYNHKDVPIIAVTAYATRREKEIISAAFDDYISKPINEENLLGVINKWIGE